MGGHIRRERMKKVMEEREEETKMELTPLMKQLFFSPFGLFGCNAEDTQPNIFPLSCCRNKRNCLNLILSNSTVA